MKKFDTYKLKEQALVLLMLEFQDNLIQDSTKGVLDGIKFGWMGTEIITAYRYSCVLKNKYDKLNKSQTDILNRFLEYARDLSIPLEWFDSEWLEEHYISILNKFEIK